MNSKTKLTNGSARRLWLKPVGLLAVMAVAGLMFTNCAGRGVKSLSSHAETGISFTKMAEMEAEVVARVEAIYDEVIGCYNSQCDINSIPDFNTTDYLTSRLYDMRQLTMELCELRGDMYPIDWNHWVQGQDWSDLSIDVDSVRVTAENASQVYVTLHNGGTKTPMRLDMSEVTGNWLIDDFVTNGIDGTPFSLSEYQTLNEYCSVICGLMSLQGSWDYLSNHPDCYPNDPTQVDVAAHYYIHGDTLTYPKRCDPSVQTDYIFTIDEDILTLNAIGTVPDDMPSTFTIKCLMVYDTLFTTEMMPDSPDTYNYVNIKADRR